MSCCLYLLSLRRAVGVIVLLLRRYSNPITAQLIAEYIKKVESFLTLCERCKVEEKEETPVTTEVWQVSQSFLDIQSYNSIPARKEHEWGGRLVGAGVDDVESIWRLVSTTFVLCRNTA